MQLSLRDMSKSKPGEGHEHAVDWSLLSPRTGCPYSDFSLQMLPGPLLLTCLYTCHLVKPQSQPNTEALTSAVSLALSLCSFIALANILTSLSQRW